MQSVAAVERDSPLLDGIDIRGFRKDLAVRSRMYFQAVVDWVMGPRVRNPIEPKRSDELSGTIVERAADRYPSSSRQKPPIPEGARPWSVVDQY